MKSTDLTGIFCEHGPKNWQVQASGPLAGKTLAVKDLFQLKGYKNTAGNPDWFASHEIADTSSASLEKLMQAGCVFTGFTHSDEIAYSLEGNNIHYGAAQNPKLAGHACGGSSMGSAAAVAANLAEIGLGTDTGGSVRIPASYCGLYGIRTTHNAISRAGLIGLADEFDTVGWFCKDATLLKTVGEVLLPAKPVQKVETLLVCDALFDLVEAEFKPYLEANLNQLKAQFKQIKSLELPAELLAKLPDSFRVLQGRAIAREHKDWIESAQPTFAPAIASRFEMALKLTETEEDQARLVQQQLQQLIAEQLDETSCLYMPTTPTAAPKIGVDVSDLRMQIINLSAIAGLTTSCQIHLPLNVSQPTLNGQKLPYGFSLMMAKGQDLSLLSLVEHISQTLNWEQY
ncbi:amidase family protein [Catenovulum sp. 2E275]|uniref:amidase family protein n=1 Tax=Catenovulum sp. 2E275 TaxID=2980497 RepID=UPI0021D34C21|nr:amidase family protein [Catenovulum sp. 2E275]MCU4677411.1 amidase family protein [Catenovulum sp. 2E275]